MPFRECSIVFQREEFCRLAMADGANVRELCRRFGISPGTGYKWLARYRALGAAGLVERSRRPASSPGRTGDEVAAAVLAVRHAHPAWGGRKIRRVLHDQGLVAPAASTVTGILRRAGRLDGPGAGEPRAFQRFEHAAANDLWQMDFKGWFALANGYCHPLTILDDHSRYALDIGACANEQEETVQARLQAVFEQYGLPRRMLADNGPPWGTAGQAEYSRLGVWLLDLGIRLVHGKPYHPQTQGKDERFHRTLKAEVLAGRSFADLAAAQAAFESWRHVYNTKRPHEGIGLNVPASRYAMSPRPMLKTIAPPQYEAAAHVRKADEAGNIAFKGRRFKASKAFAGRRLALRATETDGLFDLCYRHHRLAQIDLRHNSIQPVHHVPQHVSTISTV